MKWISVKDRLPEKDALVLVINTKYKWYEVYLAIYSSYGYFMWNNTNLYSKPPIDATHWCDIPELPKELGDK